MREICLSTADRDLLIRYAEQFGNGAIFKRLGYLAGTRLHDWALAEACRARLTQGYVRLDPALPSPNLITAWRVWVPRIAPWRRGDGFCRAYHRPTASSDPCMQ